MIYQVQIILFWIFSNDREDSTYQKAPLIYAIDACNHDLVRYLLTSTGIDINRIAKKIFLIFIVGWQKKFFGQNSVIT